MTARNIVNRILINPESPVDEQFDRCLIETELGDVFAMICFQIIGKPRQYRVTIYKTAIYVGEANNGVENSNYISRVINVSQPVYMQSFYAATPMFKRGMLSNMLECIQEDDADTWENLKKEFGCEDASAVYESRGQVAIC